VLTALINVGAVIPRCFSLLVLVVLVSRDAAADRPKHTVMGHVPRDGPSRTAREAADCHDGSAQPDPGTQSKQSSNRDAHLHQSSPVSKHIALTRYLQFRSIDLL
jgi:hypothetical protein